MSPSSAESHFAGPSGEDLVWRWRGTDTAGGEIDLPDAPQFSSRGDAETWIGESWRDLLEQGVAAVTLLEDERVVYGPMGLDEG